MSQSYMVNESSFIIIEEISSLEFSVDYLPDGSWRSFPSLKEVTSQLLALSVSVKPAK